MKQIGWMILDVDGTLTDGRIYMAQSGELFKAFNIKDGYGIHDILIPHNIVPVVITGRESLITSNRCEELGITELYQGIKDKVGQIKKIMERYAQNGNSIDYSMIAYMGDDINDLPAMALIKEHGGLVGCPIDAVPEIKALANFVSAKAGGNGAVREFIEWVVQINDSKQR